MSVFDLWNPLKPTAIQIVWNNDGSSSSSSSSDSSSSSSNNTAVNDDMSFNEAFSTAREEAGGGGGTFTWNGNEYSTAVTGEDKALDAAIAADNNKPAVSAYDDDDEDYTPTSAELNKQLSDAGKTNLTTQTQTVDYSTTSSGNDYTSAAQSDNSDNIATAAPATTYTTESVGEAGRSGGSDVGYYVDQDDNSVSGAATTGPQPYATMGVGEAGRGQNELGWVPEAANINPDAYDWDDVADSQKYVNSDMNELDRMADAALNASFVNNRPDGLGGTKIADGSVIDKINNAQNTSNFFYNSPQVYDETAAYNFNAGNQNTGNDNTNTLTEAQLANAMDNLDPVEKILIEEYGWTLSQDGTKAVSAAGTDSKGNLVDYNDPSEAEAAKAAADDAITAKMDADNAIPTAELTNEEEMLLASDAANATYPSDPTTPDEPTPPEVGVGTNPPIISDPSNPIIPPPPTDSCPTPDMLIRLADGTEKAAGDIEVGDVVHTAHEDTMEWGDFEVTRAEIKQDKIVKVEFSEGSITCSPTHKLYNPETEEWVKVQDLKEGDTVSTKDGTVEWVSTSDHGEGDIVVLTVDGAHTYVCEGILSHNKTPLPEVPPELVNPLDPVETDPTDPVETDPVDPTTEPENVDPNNPDDTFADTNNDGVITALEAEIANLRQQLALLTNSSTTDTDGLTREEILLMIQNAMRNNNANNYNPLAYMNAFGFSAMPSYFGNTIPTYMSQDGVYERRAVRDRDTGEIRYVNVPIGNASLAGTGGFQRRRRAGFGGNFDNF